MKTCRRTAVLCLSLAISSAFAAPDVAAGTGRSPRAVSPGGALPLPLFPADSWWNLDISSAPVDPGSASFISFVGATRRLHPDFGGVASPTGPEAYGMPYVVVDGTQARKTVSFLYADESDGAGEPYYPIPDEAITQPFYVEGGPPGNVDLRSQSDRHLLVVDRDNRLLYELWNVWFDGMAWHAGSGARFDLRSNARRPDGWTSADAAGLAILPGLVRWDEVYGTGEIGHAFRVTVRATNGYVFPASHRAGSNPQALPMGARLRLKAGKDVSGFPPEMQRVFRAMKKYGLIVADNGSDMYVTGTFDTRWDNDVLNPAFAALTAANFEVVQLGWNPSAAPAGCTADASTLCLLGDRFQARVTWKSPYDGSSGIGQALPLTSDTGAFWFFSKANLELVVKAVDGRSFNNAWWIFYGALSDLEYELVVTDTATGASRTYHNPPKNLASVADTSAFPP